MFADDSTLHTQKKTVEELERELNVDLENISAWCKSNKMATNTTKTHSMLVTTWQKLLHLDKKEMEVYYEGQKLENSESEKVLGVIIDKHLTWNKHVGNVHSKVSQALYAFRKIKSHLPHRHRKMYYNAFIQPHFDYCSIVWSTTSGYNMKRLIKLQKRAARLILECPVRTSSDDTFSTLKWMTLPERIKFRKLTMVYKAIHHLCPAYISEMFQGVNSVHSRTTRNAEEGNLYPTTFAKLETLNKTFKHSSIEAWNSLPTHIKEAQSVHSFKRLYSDYYFGNRQIAE